MKKYFMPYALSVTCAFALLAFAPSAQAINITNVSVNNFSNPDQLVANGNYLVREYRSDIISTSPVTVSGNEASFDNHFAFFQDMRVDQPNGPNAALIYRKNIGYEMTFTVEDPLNVGYSIDVDHLMKGYVTVSREEPIAAQMGVGLMLGRIDAHDGNGPIHYAGFSTNGGGVAISAAELPTVQTNAVNNLQNYTIPVSYVGTNTFTISFSSFPSPALVNIFQNNGGGEGVAQFGLPPTHVSGGDPSRPDFQYDDETGSDTLADLGHFATVRVIANDPDTDGDGVTDNQDNCPFTSNSSQTDTDGDGKGDACDVCPNDPGTAGEGDSDGDGTPDCQDDCQSDSSKTSPGVCGCGTPDIDTDGDGVADCNDNCPTTPNPDQADSNNNGVGDVCDCVPTAEVCDGQDNDCDGFIDEDLAPIPTSCGIGACLSNGEITCVNGNLVDDCAPGTPAANDSVCNGVDDDCDGIVDEEFTSLPTSCGIGACAAAGQTSCVNGNLEDSCTPGTPALDDAVCDGIDNDCDAQIDEDYVALSTSCGVGECGATGLTSCVNGVEEDSCTPGQPQPEICDNLDNDCDAAVDEEVDTDNDGVFECGGPDVCLNTTADVLTGKFNKNHYANLDGDNTLEAAPGTKNVLNITLADTAGCSCTQIAEAWPGNNSGWYKHGCPKGIVEQWIEDHQ